MSIELIKEMFKNPEYAMIIGCILAILVISLIIIGMKNKALKRRLDDLELDLNALRCEPLSFKLQKTMALAKANNEVAELVPECKAKFDLSQDAIAKIADLLADADDFLYEHKRKKAANSMNQAEELIDEIRDTVTELSKFMDQVLENESVQRADITKLKEQYRNLRSYYVAHSKELQNLSEYIESEFKTIEELFSKFEEYIFASEFDSSKEVSDRITSMLVHLDNFISHTPSLMELANVTLKNMIDEVNNLYLKAVETGIVLKELEVNKNLDLIQEILEQDLADMHSGKDQEIEESLQNCVLRLNQLSQQIEREAKSFEQFNNSLPIIKQGIEEEMKNMDSFKLSYEKNRERFGYDNWDTFIDNNISQLNVLMSKVVAIENEAGEKETAYSSLIITLKQYEEALKHMSKEIGTLSDKLSTACKDEKRAIEQVEKLYLTLHEIQVDLRKNHLPSIGGNYDLDLKQGYDSLKVVEDNLNQIPLNITRLNQSLDMAIDHIYKLHNQVNQLVGSANMVENAIVFANKYRSSMPEVDNELTRAELCFKNGEYTQALTISIQTIEKIHPGAYESLIRAQEAKR